MGTPSTSLFWTIACRWVWPVLVWRSFGSVVPSQGVGLRALSSLFLPCWRIRLASSSCSEWLGTAFRARCFLPAGSGSFRYPPLAGLPCCASFWLISAFGRWTGAGKGRSIYTGADQLILYGQRYETLSFI